MRLELIASTSLKNKIRLYYNVNKKGRHTIVDQLHKEHRGTLTRARWKLRETYDGPQLGDIYVLASSNDRFYYNYLFTRINWKNDFINDVCTPNLPQAENLIANIDNELRVRNDKKNPICQMINEFFAIYVSLAV